MLGLVGAGVVGYAIASAGDALARAYATAHVHPAEADGGSMPKPAIEYATDELMRKIGQVLPTPAVPAHHSHFVKLEGDLRARTLHHADSCRVLALRWDDEHPDELLYLVAHPDEAPAWMEASKLEVVR